MSNAGAKQKHRMHWNCANVWKLKATASFSGAMRPALFTPRTRTLKINHTRSSRAHWNCASVLSRTHCARATVIFFQLIPRTQQQSSVTKRLFILSA